MKVSVIQKGEPDNFGRIPVVIRINEGERRQYITTEYRVHPDDFEDGLIKADPAANQKIRQLAIRHESDRIEGKRKYRDGDFFTYVEKCFKEWDQVRAYNTMRNYKAETEKLKQFDSSFKLSQVTPAFLTAYSNHLYQQGNISTTVWTSFKFLRTVILKALREKVIEDNPFVGFKMPQYKDPAKEYLTKEEVAQLEKWLPKAGPLKLCATWFVIGCYTGLRYSDMNAFDKEKNIRSGRIVLATKKTKDIVSMPVSKRLAKLFSSINYQSMFISNQKFNDALKEIGKKTGLGDLNVHKARHTFGVLCADAGISIEVTARLMGHANIRATAIYYKITNPRIDKELKKLG